MSDSTMCDALGYVKLAGELEVRLDQARGTILRLKDRVKALEEERAKCKPSSLFTWDLGRGDNAPVMNVVRPDDSWRVVVDGVDVAEQRRELTSQKELLDHLGKQNREQAETIGRLLAQKDKLRKDAGVQTVALEARHAKINELYADKETLKDRIRELEKENARLKHAQDIAQGSCIGRDGGLSFGLEGPKFHPFIEQEIAKRDKRIAELEAQHEDLVRRNAALRDRPDMKPERIRAVQELEVERDLARDAAEKLWKESNGEFDFNAPCAGALAYRDMKKGVKNQVSALRRALDERDHAQEHLKRLERETGCFCPQEIIALVAKAKRMAPTVVELAQELAEGRQAIEAVDSLLKRTGCECVGDIADGWSKKGLTIEGLRYANDALMSEIGRLKRGES